MVSQAWSHLILVFFLAPSPNRIANKLAKPQFSRNLFSKHSRRSSDNRLRSVSPGPEPRARTPPPTELDRSRSVGSEETLLAANTAEHYTHSARPGAGSHSERSHSTPTVLPVHRKQSQSDRASDPQGLSLLHSPEEPHVADIILVHGLGGSGMKDQQRKKGGRFGNRMERNDYKYWGFRDRKPYDCLNHRWIEVQDEGKGTLHTLGNASLNGYFTFINSTANFSTTN